MFLPLELKRLKHIEFYYAGWSSAELEQQRKTGRMTTLMTMTVRTLIGLKSWLRIRIHFIRIRIQHFRLNTDPDPDPIRIRGFND
jgi:hypothetical protein